VLKTLIVLSCLIVFSGLVFAKEATIKVFLVSEQGVGKEIGTVTASDSKYGLVMTPQLSDLTPGLHGFHVHAKPDCSPAMMEGKPAPALAAGGITILPIRANMKAPMVTAILVICLPYMWLLMERQPSQCLLHVSR